MESGMSKVDFIKDG